MGGNGKVSGLQKGVPRQHLSIDSSFADIIDTVSACRVCRRHCATRMISCKSLLVKRSCSYVRTMTCPMLEWQKPSGNSTRWKKASSTTRWPLTSSESTSHDSRFIYLFIYLLWMIVQYVHCARRKCKQSNLKKIRQHEMQNQVTHIVVCKHTTTRKANIWQPICLLIVFISRSKSFLFSQAFTSVLWNCWLGDRKGIRPAKHWVLVCWWWWFDWSFARLVAPSVTTACIIVSFNKTV